MGSLRILVPDVLASVRRIEDFNTIVGAAPAADRYLLDMAGVSFVRPCGAIVLLSAARRLTALSNEPVVLQNLKADVHSYLHRLDLLDVGGAWLVLHEDLSAVWARDPATANLLEVTPIAYPSDVAAIVSRARRIFARWLALPDLNGLLSVLSEVCANVYQHSGDAHGCALIQRYEVASRGQAVVEIAVGDQGRGIRGSLMGQHGPFRTNALDYLYAAMGGWSARPTGRGGLGLRVVEQTVAVSGGLLWVRSDTASVMTRGPGTAQGRDDLPPVPGVQVVVELRSPL